MVSAAPTIDYQAAFKRASNLVRAAERDLGPLSDGERRDLITDNTDFDRGLIFKLVEAMDA